jgi:hypothetical protein
MTLLMHRLRQAGKNVPLEIYSVPDARDAILAMLEGNRK